MLQSEKKTVRETACYTYEVTMIVQVIASSKGEADEKLDREGGYISNRDVSFRNSVDLYSGEPEQSWSTSAESKTKDTTK